MWGENRKKKAKDLQAFCIRVHIPEKKYSTPLAEDKGSLLGLPTMSSERSYPHIAAGDHKAYMEYALSRAQLSPQKQTNFGVGALVVDADKNSILATGYSQELEEKAHAEHCCFMKIAKEHNVCEEELGAVLPANTVLYTTMEPCNKRSVGHMTCVDRILRYGNGIKIVYVGILEPEKFVGVNVGRKRLVEAGIGFELLEGLEKNILEVSTAGHID